MSLKYRNLRHNRSISLCSEGFLCGQRVGILPEFRYGLCSMAFNGCEVIAVYNALLYLGKPALLCDISFFMEKYKISNMKSETNQVMLRIISHEKPVENAMRVEASLEDVFLYYFGEKAGDENAAL